MENGKALQGFTQEMALKGYSEHTIKSREYILKRLLIFLDGKELTEEGIRSFLLSLKEVCSSNTLFTYACHIKAFCEFTGKDFDIPLPKTEKKLPVFLTREEIQRLMTSIDDKRDLAILRLLYSTGMRVSELVEMQYADIEGNTIKIEGKGKKERIVYVDDETLKLLPKKKRGNIFKISARQIQLIVKKYAKKAGIVKKVTPHTLRHTFATHLLQNGASIVVIKNLLGHSSLSTTQIYTHVTDRYKEETYERFHPFSK